MIRPSTAQRRDDRKYGVNRRGGAEADSFENELGERAAVTDVGRRSQFRADVAGAAAFGKISRGDVMKAFSRFDELTAGGSYSNKARPSATSFSRQPAAGGLRENWGAQMRGSVNSFTNNASQEYSQAWWDKSRKGFGDNDRAGGARFTGGDSFYDSFGTNKQFVAESPVSTPGFGNNDLSAFADRMGQFSLRQSALDISRDERWKNSGIGIGIGIGIGGERTFETPDIALQNPFGADDDTDPLFRKTPWENSMPASQLFGGR